MSPEWILLAAMTAVVALVSLTAKPPPRPTAAEIRRDLAAAWPDFIAARYGADLDAAARDFDVPLETVAAWLAGRAPEADAVALALVLNWGLEGKMVRLWRAAAAHLGPRQDAAGR